MTNHRYKINDIASLYSRAQWEKMQPLPEDEYGYFELFVPSLSDGIRLDVRMLRGEMPTQSGFVIVINDSFIEVVDPYYLCFELMRESERIRGENQGDRNFDTQYIPSKIVI